MIEMRTMVYIVLWPRTAPDGLHPHISSKPWQNVARVRRIWTRSRTWRKLNLAFQRQTPFGVATARRRCVPCPFTASRPSTRLARGILRLKRRRWSNALDYRHRFAQARSPAHHPFSQPSARRTPWSNELHWCFYERDCGYVVLL